MIIGKNSALKGFALFLWAVCVLLALIGCVTTKEWVFIIPSVAASAMSGWAIYDVYSAWSDDKA